MATSTGIMPEPGSYAAVAPNVPLDGPFHYRIPAPLRAALQAGARVRVPFGRREMTGVCVGLVQTPDIEESRIKDIVRLLDRPPILNARMLELARWMASYYHCSWGEALEALLPSSVKKGHSARTIILVRAMRSRDELRSRAEQVEKRARRQARLLRALATMEGEVAAGDLLSLAEADYSVLKSLAKTGDLSLRREKTMEDASLSFKVQHSEPPELTAHQAKALERIVAALDGGAFHVALLHGVTGSGKTEVYLQALARCVASGRQAIVLVPEIALTPQTVARFRSRFERVRVLHSELTESNRREQWLSIQRGEADVVIGARSAVFAPFPRLGLVVVDEEHEGTFKQQSIPRYHGRDAAIWRAQQDGAVVILGSATPSLESYYNAVAGKYELLELPERIDGRPMPPVEVINLGHEAGGRGAPPLLSRKLRLALETTLKRGEQAILFLNRRGFHTFVTCPRCGYALRCPNCDVSLIFHRRHDITQCHYCGHECKPPQTCPGCNSTAIRYGGTGTERIEEEISRLFGAQHVARMDSDSMRGRGKYEKTLEDFRDGKTRILLGTQMVAKGLDFPNVTLVGVVNADISMNMPDFRASERTFQLLAQVAGRTGRGDKGGRVIIQTFSPDHPCVRDAARHDYASFAKRELRERRRHSYPPFSRVARIVCEGKSAEAVQRRCGEIVEAIKARAEAGRVTVLGPAEAPIARIKCKARWHALIKAPDSASMKQALQAVDRRKSGGVDVSVDVDPVGMM